MVCGLADAHQLPPPHLALRCHPSLMTGLWIVCLLAFAVIMLLRSAHNRYASPGET